MTIYQVTLGANSGQKYSVTLGANNNLRLGVVSPTVRPALTYHLETPANTNLGLIDLVVDVTNSVVDTIPIVGGGSTNVFSNGTAIIVSSTSSVTDIDGGTF